LTRARLAESSRNGLVVPEGLIAHGRGEAFDYLLGERTTPSARRATRIAAQWLRAARHPVVSVNGNVAALAARELAGIQRALPRIGVEVNLFHRTPGRAARVARTLERAGVRHVLGVRPTAKIPGLPSDRAFVDRRGILVADVCLVPLEDGDRTEALRALGKRVISVDLNPLSRTSEQADLPIVDEVVRTLRNLAADLRVPGPDPVPGRFASFSAPAALRTARATIHRRLRKERPSRSPPASRRR
jgi:4-phosphopantoate--beta-alanine ligase